LLSATVAFAARDGHKLTILDDPYTHLKTAVLSGIPTDACKGDPSLAFGADVVTILIGASQDKDGGVNYWFTTETSLHYQPLHVLAGGKVSVLIDGKPTEFFTPVGSTYSRYDSPFGPQQVETDNFKISRADIEKISHASSLQFRVEGSQRTLQRCATQKHLIAGAELLGKLPELENRSAATTSPQ
jgi:hypothetical protein